MSKNDTIPQSLSKFTQCHYEIGGVIVNVPKKSLISPTPLGLPKSQCSYQDSVNQREKLLNYERLWSDLVYEEMRWNTKYGNSSKGEDKEEIALDQKEKKGKGNKSQSKAESS